MKPVTTRQSALIGLIGAVLLSAVGILMLKAAGGAYNDDYKITAVVDRAGFGLDNASTVKVRGVTVGGVTSVALQDDGTVLVSMSIRKEVTIPMTATASIEPLSVFGPKFVDIAPGADESDGPFMDEGGQIVDTIAPSEIIETLDKISTLLENVDETKVASILGELARSVDGLGDELGATLDSTDEVAQILLRNRDALDALLADARLVGETLETRGDEVVDISRNSAAVLDTVIRHEDDLGSILRSVSHISTDLAATVTDSGGDLDLVINGLDRVSSVLFAQLAEIPAFVDFTERTFRLLAQDLPQWDIGNGRLGAVLDAVLTLDTCALVVLAGCPPLPELDR